MSLTPPSISLIPKRSLVNNSVKRDGRIEASPFSTPVISVSNPGLSETDGVYFANLLNLINRDCIPNL